MSETAIPPVPSEIALRASRKPNRQKVEDVLHTRSVYAIDVRFAPERGIDARRGSMP